MKSPFFELTLYLGLGLVCGVISVLFTRFREIFVELFEGKSWGKKFIFSSIPVYIRPILGGILCGVTAVFFPQTLFVGYVTLDQLLSGKINIELPNLLGLLGIKIILTSFSLSTGLVGGVFAPGKTITKDRIYATNST